MKETLELRLNAEFVHLVLEDHEGERLGVGRTGHHDSGNPYYSVRLVKISGHDPRIATITALQRELKETGKGFLVAGWNTIRTYSDDELNASPWLHFLWKKGIMSSGEDCSTVYDESHSCGELLSVGNCLANENRVPGKKLERCSWGAIQVNLLALSSQKIPKTRDVTCTFADEWVVSDRFKESFPESFLGSAWYNPILQCGKQQGHGVERRSNDYIADRHQLNASDGPFEIVAPTIIRDHVINYQPECQEAVCPKGHTLGLNLVSELYLSEVSRPAGHIFRTTNGYGIRRGLFRPRAPLVVSQEFFRRWKASGLKGADFEVVHLI